MSPVEYRLTHLAAWECVAAENCYAKKSNFWGSHQTPALLLGTLAQLVSTWYFDMITAFIPKWYSKNLLPSTITTVIQWLKIVRVLGTASLGQQSGQRTQWQGRQTCPRWMWPGPCLVTPVFLNNFHKHLVLFLLRCLFLFHQSPKWSYHQPVLAMATEHVAGSWPCISWTCFVWWR